MPGEREIFGVSLESRAVDGVLLLACAGPWWPTDMALFVQASLLCCRGLHNYQQYGSIHLTELWYHIPQIHLNMVIGKHLWRPIGFNSLFVEQGVQVPKQGALMYSLENQSSTQSFDGFLLTFWNNSRQCARLDE